MLRELMDGLIRVMSSYDDDPSPEQIEAVLLALSEAFDACLN